MNKKFLIAISLVAIFCLSACEKEAEKIEASSVGELTPEIYENSI